MTTHDNDQAGALRRPDSDQRHLALSDDHPEPESSPMPHATAIPPAHERDRLNAALAATGADTGFWDARGIPAPWPDDIDDWTPETHPTDPQNPHDF